MLRHALTRHADTPSTAIERVEAFVMGDERGALRLCYRLVGDAQRVAADALPSGAMPQRRDELWRRTCCELFVQDADGSGYVEYNFAPCGDWAAYRFESYRAGRAACESSAPRIVLERTRAMLTLTVTLLDQPLEALAGRRIGLACIAATANEVSYWALAHPAGAPDFHHLCAFAATVAITQCDDNRPAMS